MRFHSYMWWPAGACYLHRGQPESFHLAACHGQKTIFHVVNSVFRVLQVKPEEEDLKETQNFTSYLLSNFTKHLIVTMDTLPWRNNTASGNIWWACNPSSRCLCHRENMFFFILWSTSPLVLPPFLYPCLQAQPAAWIQIRTLFVLMIKRERNYKGLVILSADH